MEPIPSPGGNMSTVEILALKKYGVLSYEMLLMAWTLTMVNNEKKISGKNKHHCHKKKPVENDFSEVNKLEWSFKTF